MNKLLLFISTILIFGVSLVSLVSLVSASHYDYFDSGYDSNYYTENRASVPIFRGPYSNYRYQMYASGDVRPNYFFRSYGGYGGGFGGGYYGYPSYGVGFGYGGFSYGPYYTNYRPGPYFRSFLI